MIIEEIVRDYLSKKLILTPVRLELPNNPPDIIVVLEKTGSNEVNHIKSATFAIQSYSKSMLDAMELNEQVKQAMKDIVELDQIGACNLNSDYNFTDTTTKKYRYQAVFDITHY